jgi:hypothetical protein
VVHSEGSFCGCATITVVTRPPTNASRSMNWCIDHPEYVFTACRCGQPLRRIVSHVRRFCEQDSASCSPRGKECRSLFDFRPLARRPQVSFEPPCIDRVVHMLGTGTMIRQTYQSGEFEFRTGVGRVGPPQRTASKLSLESVECLSPGARAASTTWMIVRWPYEQLKLRSVR